MSDSRATATALFNRHFDASSNPIIDVLEGQNAVVVVGRDQLLRLPKTPEAAARLDRVERLGAALGPLLPIVISQPRVIRVAGSDASCVSIERRLPGDPLSPAVVSALPIVIQRAIARQLGLFLRALHGIAPDSLPAEVNLPVVDPRGEWNELVRRARTRLEAWWSVALERRLMDEARQFEATFAEDAVTALRHGDFGGANILFDRDTQQVTAILDFESAAIGDPAYDYASGSTLGTLLGDAMFDAVGLSPLQRRRAASYRASFPLQEALLAVSAGELDRVAPALGAYA